MQHTELTDYTFTELCSLRRKEQITAEQYIGALLALATATGSPVIHLLAHCTDEQLEEIGNISAQIVQVWDAQMKLDALPEI